MNVNLRQTFTDRLISRFAPTWGAKRMHSRAQISIASNVSSGYDVPGSGKRFMRGFKASANSPDADLILKRPGMVAASRDLSMNNALSIAALSRKTTNTVGAGLRIQIQPDHTFLGIDVEQAKIWASNTERSWRVYADSKDCDITRTQNFYELTELIWHSVLLSGDICVTYPFKKIKGFDYGTRIRLIESDLLSNPTTSPTFIGDIANGNLAGGVKLDSDGAPFSYFFTDTYPGANLSLTSSLKWTEIKAFNDDGERQVYHLFMRKRPGQRRGIPLLGPLINLIKKVTKLADAELTAHVVAAFFTVFIKDMQGYNSGLAEGYSPDNQVTDKDINPDEAFNYEMGSGNILELDDRKDIEIAQSRNLSESFEPFYNSFVKELAAGLEMPHEQLMMHFTASYSASRGALLEGWKTIRKDRAWVANNFCTPAFEHWLDEMVANGRIIAPGYFEDPAIQKAWRRATWSGMGNGQLDPKKETEAALMRISGKLSNFEKEYNLIHDDGTWDGAMDTLQSNYDVIDNKELGRNLLPKDNLIIEQPEESVTSSDDDDTDDDTDTKGNE